MSFTYFFNLSYGYYDFKRHKALMEKVLTCDEIRYDESDEEDLVEKRKYSSNSELEIFEYI